jgi:hypothetical protein
VLYHDPSFTKSVPHSGAYEGAAHRPCVRQPEMTRTNNVVIALKSCTRSAPRMIRRRSRPVPDRLRSPNAPFIRNADRSDGRPVRHRFAVASRCRPPSTKFSSVWTALEIGWTHP